MNLRSLSWRSLETPLIFLALSGSASITVGCGGGTPSGTTQTPGSGKSTPLEPGQTVQIEPSAAANDEEGRVRGALADVADLTADAFAARYPVAFESPKHYELSGVGGLNTIQASALALDDAELSALSAQGFAISSSKGFSTFAYGYDSIYAQDLPVYISADSIMNALHLSYDDILKTLETAQLRPSLDTLLQGMRSNLKRSTAAVGVRSDADTFLCVAQSLLRGSLVTPEGGATASQVAELFDKAEAASGTATFTLFGVLRTDEDFSQFKPRGHYTDSVELERYFRAMMWLGRVDLRLLETQADGSQLFRRQQLEIMVQLRELVSDGLMPHYDRIDQTVGAFVGEHDYMHLAQVDQLLADLGISGSAELTRFSDQELAQAIIDGGYGAQRISSHIMISPPHEGALPLNRSFALLGQRYVLDSHVFSNVVYDRVGDRMMPDPLDAAFAVFGNAQAGQLLVPQLEQYESAGYPGALAQMRVLADQHPAEYWKGSLYTLWLGALRQLSPEATSGAADASTLFPAARSEAWGKRLLNTQLASWAELRHDTILYAKQSYTGGATCDFPDAYVDPYPAFYTAVAEYGTRGSALAEALQLGSEPWAERIRTHFSLVTSVAKQLGEMAEHERSGAEFTPEMLAFINQAVKIQLICGGADFEDGWYKQLFFNPTSALELSPTIADVHTQPTDQAGNPVGKVLHVGTGTPRLMVVISEGCSGPRAYAGVASSYKEVVTENFERLDDLTWKTGYLNAPEVSWMNDLVLQ